MTRAYTDALASGATVVPVLEQSTIAVASHRMRGRQDPDRHERDNAHACQYMPGSFHKFSINMTGFTRKVKRVYRINLVFE
jgi:hypothetical protein